MNAPCRGDRSRARDAARRRRRDDAGRTSSPARAGSAPITRFDTTDQKAKIAGEVKPKDHAYGFDPDKRVDHKVQRQVDPFIVYAIDAAGQALEDAGLTEMDEDTQQRAGVSIGSGIGGLPGIESESLVLPKKGPAGSARTSSTAG